jgi:hypothetical protein
LSIADTAADSTNGGASVGIASGFAARARILALQGDRLGANSVLLALERVFDGLPDRIRVHRHRGQRSWKHSLMRLRPFGLGADLHLGLRQLACALICHRQLARSFSTKQPLGSRPREPGVVGKLDAVDRSVEFVHPRLAADREPGTGEQLA